MKYRITLRLAAAAALALGTATSALALTGWNDPGPLTREQVRESLRIARAAGTMSTFGEAGDTEAVLTARANFNALQAEVMLAEMQRDELRLAALDALTREQAAQQAMAAETNADAFFAAEVADGDPLAYAEQTN